MMSGYKNAITRLSQRTVMHCCYRRAASSTACTTTISLLSKRQSSWKQSSWQPHQSIVCKDQQQVKKRAALRHFAVASPLSGGGGGEKDDDDDKSNNNNNNNNIQKSGTEKEKASSSIIPGLALSYMTALAGFSTASAISGAVGIPLSGIPVSILLGMTIKNTLLSQSSSFSKYNPMLQPGITFATKTVLQAGIVCVAAKLSFIEVLATGTSGIPVVVSSMTAGMIFIPMASRMAGLPIQMSLLLTAGTSICGVTAITALAPAISAPHRDVAVAVANTVAFGTIGMLTYPYLFHALCTSSEQLGMCLGVAIHDTSQVLGAALSCKEVFHDEVAFKVAAVTKLMRNLGLAVAIPALTYSYHASIKKENEQKEKSTNESDKTVGKEDVSTISGLQTFTKYVPPFLVAFLGVSALRSVGDYMIPDMEAYQLVMNFAGNELSKNALGIAMAGVGLSTSASSLRGVGWKPFAVGAAGAMVVGGTGFTVAMLTV
jgi:uncharacterized integral membrane protein (TIGR00698 family)